LDFKIIIANAGVEDGALHDLAGAGAFFFLAFEAFHLSPAHGDQNLHNFSVYNIIWIFIFSYFVNKIFEVK